MTKGLGLAPVRGAVAALISTAAILAAPMASAQTVFMHQGSDWTGQERSDFYVRDQGSRIMPIAWMRALEAPDGSGFLDDALARYGYLPMPGRADADVPVGFTVANLQGEPNIGMTCSACHTRQIEVGGTKYRIDGGPGVVDFQSFLADLDTATQKVANDGAAFDAFAEKVLGGDASSADKDTLEADFKIWTVRYHTLVERSLPNPAWGPARLDAISMIFNRLTGLDIGEETDDFMIPDNIAVADAPARYPFLWNAARQDFTQWPGFASNGTALLGLARNLGEVYGVFGVFHPQKQSGFLQLNRDYMTVNSANFDGLNKLEESIRKIGPPQWPWELDHALAEQGRAIYERDTADGGCTECHGIRSGKFRPLAPQSTWATPILDVGTDQRECQILTRTVKTGVMEGARIPVIAKDRLEEEAAAFSVLSMSVLGAILQEKLGSESGLQSVATGLEDSAEEIPEELHHLIDAFPEQDDLDGMMMSATGGQPECAYESRVMEGIWAAAPYLHNGSVPTLEALLMPADQRPTSFKIGPSYDIEAVGLAVEQTMFDYTLQTTGCDNLSSGNSNCGHEFGTDLSADEKKALLEYLKAL